MSLVRPAWCEIDLDALAHNVRQVRKLAPSPVRLYAVCKNDAYGCGARDTARTMLASGADAFAVSDPEDAESIRAAGVTAPILLYASTTPDLAREVAKLGLIATVHDFESLAAYAGAGRVVDVHVEVDCGFGRLGFTPTEWTGAFDRLRRANNIRVVGLYTHLGSVEEPKAVERQATLFRRAADAARDAGFADIELMAASSRVMLGHPGLNLTAVNPGRMLYGMMEDPWLGHLDLKPVIRSIKSRVLQVKTLPDDFEIGYGGRNGRSGPLRTAVIAFGFKDGLPREPGGGAVLIRGRRAAIIGMRATEHTIIDVTDVPDAAVGDEVVIVGAQGGAAIDAHEAVASYRMPLIELLPRMTRSTPRRYLGGTA